MSETIRCPHCGFTVSQIPVDLVCPECSDYFQKAEGDLPGAQVSFKVKIDARQDITADIEKLGKVPDGPSVDS